MDLEVIDDLILSTGLILINKRQKKVKPRKVRSVWVRPYLSQRKTKGRFFKDFSDMRECSNVFKENFHVTPAEFDSLFELLKQKLYSKTKRNDRISAKEKLAMTLEFLASGSLQRHIASIYRISKQAMGKILDETCDAIFEVLQREYLKVPTTQEDWMNISNEFHSSWQFPNCVGTIDGKHVAIQCPRGASSCFYNYKGFHSIVLMAVADAGYRFIYADIGGFGSEGDSTVFRKCRFGSDLLNKRIALPVTQPVYGKHLPFYFLADDAFPLHENILKPFKPARKCERLPIDERTFNYRLSRARRCVENAFGILCAKWVCLKRSMFLKPDRAQKIVAACVVLHNFLLKDFRENYCPVGFADSYDEIGNYVPGNWRSVIPENSLFNNTINNQAGGRPNSVAIETRNHLKNYFMTPEGEASWQNCAIFEN